MKTEARCSNVHVGKSTFLKVLCLMVILGVSCPLMRGLAEEADLSMQEISYATEDEVTIYGSWIVSQSKEKKSKKSPVVILLHDYGFDRRDWGIFIPDLVQQGYNVLAIDMRGHGKSTEGGRRLSGQYSPSVASYVVQSGYLDVQAALKWIKRRKDTDTKNISLVGVGLGADITYFCSGKFRKAIKASVVISPSVSAITEGRFTESTPRAVLFCTSAGDANGSSMIATESLANFTDNPKKLVIYNSAAHGLAIFYKHPEIKQEILAWDIIRN
jgi:pimeloyl-ACP methyl ester carboxylesterase